MGTDSTASAGTAAPLSPEAFAQLHPWPARYGNGKRQDYDWVFELAADAAAVWRV